MKGFYLDNFKGFQSELFISRQINFFVGENSTGKTSLLKLIHIFSETNFWASLNLNSSSYFKLGYFNEITSSDNFTIGLFDKKNNGDLSAIKFQFSNDNASPVVKRLQAIYKNILIEIIFQSKQLKYKYKDIKSSEKIDLKEWFTRSFDTICSDRYHIKHKVNEPLGFSVSFVIEIAHSVISRKRKEKAKEVSFNNFLVFEEFAFNTLSWISPTRDEPKRIYESFSESFSPSGSHTPILLKSVIDKPKFQDDIKAINNFGKSSGLFKSVSINQLKRTPDSPFEINFQIGEHDRTIVNVGFGVSQVLPLLIEILARGRGASFAIQQPEVHLHPRAQASFGEFVFNIAISENKMFLLETHSDFLIDRYRIACNKAYKILSDGINKLDEIKDDGKLRKKYLKDLQARRKNSSEKTKTVEEELQGLRDIVNIIGQLGQVVYFERKDGKNKLHHVEILSNGAYSDTQPENFKSFFIKEQLELIKI